MGLLTADAVSISPTQPWLQRIGLAVAAGTLSVAAADAIRVGLGSPSDSVTATMLTTAAEQLCTEATTLDTDRVALLARKMRDEIDETGIADREHARHTARSLRLIRQVDGMTRLIWMMDPETAATITTLYDRATSPAAADNDSSTPTMPPPPNRSSAITAPPNNSPPTPPPTCSATAAMLIPANYSEAPQV